MSGCCKGTVKRASHPTTLEVGESPPTYCSLHYTPTLEVGELTSFYGAYCTHFAVENLSDVTRVSLDFRLLPGCCHEEEVS